MQPLRVNDVLFLTDGRPMAEEKDKLKRQILLQQVEILLDDGNTAELKVLLADQWESDISEIVESVDNDKRRMIFDALDKATAAEVLEKVNEASTKMSNSCSKINSDTKEMNTQTQVLDNLVNKFIIE